jgi:3-hydroxybutyryl-CoA dehydrogenase
LYRIAEIMYDEYRDKRFAPPSLLRRMFIAGHHGRKTGAGFYDYSDDEPAVSEFVKR